MTGIVIHSIVCITMNGLSTITQKGQIVIPAVIREHLRLKPNMRVKIETVGEEIRIKPILTTDQAIGMIKNKKSVTREEEKQIIRDYVVRKFKKSKA